MKKLMMLVASGVLLSGLGYLRADEKKEVTLTGDGLCAKCALKEAKECQNVVIVTKDGKKKTYYLEKNDLAKKAHQKAGFCGATKDKPTKVKVVGTVEEKDGKLILTATKPIEKVEE
jgi:hypothetical protein